MDYCKNKTKTGRGKRR